MLDRLRLLPTLMLVAGLLLGLKVVHLVGGLSDITAVGSAQASDEPKPAKHGQAPASEGEGGGKSQPSQDAMDKAALANQTQQLNEAKPSPAEIAVLGSLTNRREELDKRAKELDLREQLLSAAEKRVEDRIGELKALEDKIKVQIADNDKQNDEKMAGLVKMYETMKPKEAARIFERLDMGVLIDVAKRMQPRKMSAVLAAMDPVAAQELTVELATGEKLPDAPDQKTGGPRAAISAPATPQPAVPVQPGQPG